MNALGEVGVVLAASFSQVGTHSLRLVIGDVTPGDYDNSNNEHSFDVEVVQPALQAASYCMDYYRNEYEYEAVADNPYWISTYRQRSAYEYLNETLVIPVEMQSPVGRIAMQMWVDEVERDNFEALNTPLFVYYEDGCYRYSSGSTFVGNNAYVYIQTSRDCSGFEQSYVQFQKYADTYVYFSSYYDKVWGTGSQDSFSGGVGTFLNATSSVETRFLVESGEGAFGGEGGINSLFVSPFHNEWDFFDLDTHYTGFERGVYVFGSHCDITTP